jgi:hypothetical protein
VFAVHGERRFAGVHREGVPHGELLARPQHAPAAGPAQHRVPDPHQRVSGDHRRVGGPGDTDPRLPPRGVGGQFIAALRQRLGEPVTEGGQHPGLGRHHDPQRRGPGGQRREHPATMLDPVPPRVGRLAAQHRGVGVQHGSIARSPCAWMHACIAWASNSATIAARSSGEKYVIPEP